MLSRKDYSGKLSYEEYVKRHKLREQTKKKIEEFNKKKNDKSPPALPSKKSIIDSAKEKAKEEFRKAVKNQTGIDTKEVADAYDKVKGGPPRTVEDKRKKNEIITGIAINRAIIPNTEELSDIEQDRAKISRASKIAYLNDDEFRTAQDYMNENNLGEIDKELSNDSSLVVKRPNGDTEIHYRGTAITNKPNYQDLITDASIMTGTEQGVFGSSNVGQPAQIREAEQQLQRTLTKYGSVENLGGYSRGGGIALSLGNKYNIPTTTFNPLVGPKTIAGSNTTTAKHTLIRTTEDPTTIGLAFGSPNSDNWEVKAIKPLEKYSSKIPLKNVYDAHRLDNFTEDGPRKQREAEITRAQNRQVEASRKQLERVMLGDMRDSIKNGKSFTEYMAKFNPGDTQNTPNGKRLKGTRTYGNDPYTEGWYKAGGRFTEGEAEFINEVREKGEDASPHREITEEGKNLAEFNLRQKGKPNFMGLGFEEDLQPASKEEVEAARKQAKKDREDKINRSVGEEEEALIKNLNKSDSKFKLSRSEMDEYRQGASTDNELAVKHTAAEQEHFNAIQDYDDIASAHVEHSPNEEVWRSANLTNLALGYGIGMGVQKIAELVPGDKEFEKTDAGRPTMDIVKGATTGLSQGLAQKGLGGIAKGTALEGFVGAPESVALLPEAIGGAAGYVAGDYASEAAGELTAKLGASKNTQQLASDTIGGGVGGGVGGLAAFGTAVGSDALLGTEYGSFLGPEGAAAGAIIGTGIGLGAAVYSQGVKGIVSDVKEIGGGIEKGLSSIGSAISSWF